MSKPVIPPFDEESRNVVKGANGRRIMSGGVSKRTRVRKDGSRKQVQKFIHMETEDGRILAPGDRTPVVRCACCARGDQGGLRTREKPTDGTCTAEAAVRCSREGCKAWVCPRHARRVHGQWLCRDCARRNPLGRMLRAIFFRRVEDAR